MNTLNRITRIVVEPLAPSPEVVALLTESGLPVSDIDAAPALHFLGCRIGGALAGVVGIERIGSDALLRSLAVAADYRGNGLGQALVTHLETYAAQQQLTALYLLTTTAAPFFTALGYATITRADAPPAIHNTSQFTGVCPTSATLMKKVLRRT